MDGRRRRRWTRRLLLAIPFLGATLWYASSSVVYLANLRVYFIPSASMSPTLARGDRIAIDQRGGSPKRGEIWAFMHVNGSTMVKRVVGLPGEEVRVAGGRVFLDDRPLDEPYLAGPILYEMAPVRLGPDEYFVLGDNRNASFDSHAWGPLNRAQLLGRAAHHYRPGSGLGGLR